MRISFLQFAFLFILFSILFFNWATVGEKVSNFFTLFSNQLKKQNFFRK